MGILWILFAKVGDKITHPIMKKLVYALLLYAIYAVIAEVEDIFGSKNSYHPNFRPPSHYKRGPLRLDQGHTV